MHWFKATPLGVVCWLAASALVAMPAAEIPLAPPAVRAAVVRVWQASPELAASAARRDASAARATAAAQPLYNPELVFDAENADVNRRVAGIGMTLDVNGKRRAREIQGQAGARAGEAGHALARRDVAVRWLKAWSAAQFASRQVALGQARVTLMQRFDALAEKRLRVGDVSSPERDLAALALGEAQLQQAALLGDEAAARAALQALAGDAEVAVPAMPDDLPPAVANLPPRAPDTLPESHLAQATRDEAEAGVAVARRARLPDPTVSLTGGEVLAGSRHDRVIGVAVSIPLPLRNSGRAELAAALAEATAAAAELDAQQATQRAALVESTTRYLALRAAADAFRSGRANAFAERAALLERLWRAGEIGTADYLTQLKQSLDTALSGQALLGQAWQAWIDYLAAAGRLTDWLGVTPSETSP